MARYPARVFDSTSEENQCYVHLGHIDNASPLMPVQFGWHRTAGGYGYGPTIRDHYLLHFVRRGTGIVQAHDTEYCVGAGSVFAIYPHQITYYESSAEDPWEYFWLGFEGAWAPEAMSRMGFENDRSIAVSIAEPKRVFALLEDVMGRLRSDLHLEAQMLGVIGSMHMLLQALSEGPGNAPAVPRRENIGQLGHEYTRVLLSIIETSYSERINVQELANRMNVNRSYLTELFRQDTGMSIKQYLMEYRLQRVLLRLQSPERTIKSIALECGFEDPLYLSRVFRKRFGLSPVDWRRKNRVGGGKAEDKKKT